MVADRFLVDVLARVPVFAQEVKRYSKGVWSSRLRLYPEGLFEVYFPVPPTQEQRAIVEHIARETTKLDAVRTATERTIALLEERRTALVAWARQHRRLLIEDDYDAENRYDRLPVGALQGLDPESAVELGEVLAGTHDGRTSREQITVYKSMGHAVEDAAAAGLVYRRAREQGVGTEVEL